MTFIANDSGPELSLDADAGSIELEQFEQPQQPESEQPAPQPEPEAPQPAPVNDDRESLYREMRETLQRMNQQPPAPQPQAPQAEPEWVDPAARPENVERMEGLMERMSYDPDSRREFAQLLSQMERERSQHLMQQMQRQLQSEQQQQQMAPQLISSAYEQTQRLSGYGDNLSREDWDAAVRDVFGGNTQAVHQALNPNNPASEQVRRILGDAALGRALRAGRIGQATQPPAPAPVRSANRQPSDSQPSQARSWSNPKDVDSLLAAIYENPEKYAQKGNK